MNSNFVAQSFLINENILSFGADYQLLAVVES